MDEAIPLDHPRRYASRVIRWYDLIHSTGYSTPDQVTNMIMCMYHMPAKTKSPTVIKYTVKNTVEKCLGQPIIQYAFLHSQVH